MKERLFQEFLNGPQKVYRQDNQNIYEYTISDLCLKYNIEEKLLLNIIKDNIDKSCFALDQPEPFGNYVQLHYFHFDKKYLLAIVKNELQSGIETMELRLKNKKEYLEKISKELDELDLDK